MINETVEEINESEYDVPDRRTAAMAAARAAIEKQFGKGSIVDSGAGDKLSNDWMAYVMRNMKYQDALLDAWDHMIQGDDPAEIKKIYANDLDNDDAIIGAISFYGRRVRRGEKYLSGDEISVKIEAELAERERAKQRKAKTPQPWRQPDYGYGYRTDPETGERVFWKGKKERFN